MSNIVTPELKPTVFKFKKPNAYEEELLEIEKEAYIKEQATKDEKKKKEQSKKNKKILSKIIKEPFNTPPGSLVHAKEAVLKLHDKISLKQGGKSKRKSKRKSHKKSRKSKK